MLARGDAHQAVESCRGPDRAQRPPHAARHREWRNGPWRRGRPRSRRLHATPDQLRDALGACTDLHPVYRRLLTWTLDELEVIEHHIHQLDAELAQLLQGHQDAVERLAAAPGLGVDSAQQIITEVGPTAATFPTAKRLASWVGALSGARRERGHQSQPTGAQRQSANAPIAQSGRQRRGEGQRQYL